MIKSDRKNVLIMMAEQLPTYPPLADLPRGDITLEEIYPELPEEELDFMFANYKGQLKRSREQRILDKNI